MNNRNVELPAIEKGKPERHGEVTEAVATISIVDSLEGLEIPEELLNTEYELLSEEELEAMIYQEEQVS